MNRRMLPGRALFYKYVSNSEYFKYINVGMEVFRGRRYCKEVILWQCGGMRAPLTIRSRIGLNRGMRALLTIRSKISLDRGVAWAAIEEVNITVFG